LLFSKVHQYQENKEKSWIKNTPFFSWKTVVIFLWAKLFHLTLHQRRILYENMRRFWRRWDSIKRYWNLTKYCFLCKYWEICRMVKVELFFHKGCENWEDPKEIKIQRFMEANEQNLKVYSELHPQSNRLRFVSDILWILSKVFSSSNFSVSPLTHVGGFPKILDCQKNKFLLTKINDLLDFCFHFQ